MYPESCQFVNAIKATCAQVSSADQTVHKQVLPFPFRVYDLSFDASRCCCAVLPSFFLNGRYDEAASKQRKKRATRRDESRPVRDRGRQCICRNKHQGACKNNLIDPQPMMTSATGKAADWHQNAVCCQAATLTFELGSKVYR